MPTSIYPRNPVNLLIAEHWEPIHAAKERA